jgi:hypothetical protein
VAEREVDRVALALGVAFVVVGILFLLDRLDVWDLKASYLLPVVLIAIGVAILVGARSSRPPAPPTD